MKADAMNMEGIVMKNHLTDQFDLMQNTLKELKNVIFCVAGVNEKGQNVTDQDILSKAACILAEHELIADQIAMKYGRC